MGINAHTLFVKVFYLDLPYFSNSLDIVNPVTNTDESDAIIIVCSKVNPKSNMVTAMFPDTNGEKNDTPKLPNILAQALVILLETIINIYIVRYIN